MSLLRSAHRPYSHLNDEDDLLRYPEPDSFGGPALPASHLVEEGHRTRSSWTLRNASKMCAVAAITTLVTLAVLVTVAAALLASTASPANNSSDSTVDGGSTASSSGGGVIDSVVRVRSVGCGEVAGVLEDGAFVFKGLRYAEAPVGDRRWRRPVKASPESCGAGRQAAIFGSPCLQLNPVTKKFEGSEDCLFVNVWTPRIDVTAGLEVMVWIHGGFLQLGSGHTPGLSPSGRLARKLNLVLVSFNYRLGPLGFLALGALGPETNHGLWDAALALAWVRDNIRPLGGDPNKVTVFGADAGAAVALSLLAAAPRADWGPLFRSAWLVGPASVLNRTYAQVAKHNKAFFLQRSGCTDAACLRALDAHDVIKAHLGKDDPSFRIRDQNDLPIQGIFPEQFLVVDGTLLTKPPVEMVEADSKSDIPVLIGSSTQAIDVWPGPDDLRHWSWNQYKKYVTTSLDSFGSGITQMALQLYNVTNTTDSSVTPEMVYSGMVSDLRVGCPAASMAFDLASGFQSPIYRYVTDVRPSRPVKLLGHEAPYSFHPWELVAFFDQLDLFLPAASGGPSAEDLSLRDAVQELVLSFVRSGGRSVPVPDWLRYPKVVAILTGGGLTSSSFGNVTWNTVPANSYQKTECKFWTSEGLTQYAWVS
ncbi:para-nitrobenzyl esterase [Ixodes scapularis]|uniref:para-nitrobenzyl esterase n=1 Tax=Ixodes scapularis TaxID=6945 RepID=UPI001C37FBD1|nr:para-nitrobenzyl esterase [Ixodes scapularis]